MLQETRETALVSKNRAADSMVLQSLRKKRARDGELELGQNVLVNVSEFDRGKTDHRNLLGVIEEIVDQEHGGVIVLTEHGKLDGIIYPNQYTIPSEQLIERSEVKAEPVISIREAVRLQSLTGGQGFKRCNCSSTSKCQTSRCKCFKDKLKCNSRCHGSGPCNNK